ncbi:MAG: BON domain-containing protein [Candidatus Korobacteraceae bacterium]
MPKKYLISSVAALALTLLVFAGCSQKPAPTDAQVASDVQSKIYSDAAVQSRTIAVQASNGIVTLNGNVANDAERGAAANDAATVAGVKTVVNNLQVQQAQATPPPAVAEQPAPAPPPVEKKPKREVAKSDTNRHKKHTASNDNNSDEPLLARTAPVETNSVMPPVQPAVQTPPPPPPPPQKVTIPAGTQLTVRLNEPLDSEKNQVGDQFHGSLGAPIVIDDQTVIPTGAEITGRVAAVQSAGRFAGSSLLTLELTSLSVNGKTYNLQTNQWSRQGKGEGKNTAVKAGGGAALGAIIGALASGGRGAAIGAAAGGAAGTGVAATKKGEQIKLGPEATLNFQLTSALTVTPQSGNDRNAGRTPMGN